MVFNKQEWTKKYNKDHREEILTQKKQYYKDHREKIKIQHKQYRKDNREKVKAYNKQYNKDNSDEIKRKSKIYYQNNYEKEQERHLKYYYDNYEKIRVQQKIYQENNPEVGLKSMRKQMKYIGSFLGLDSLQTTAAILSWSRTIKKRDGKKCTWCNSTENLVAHHIWHKAYCPESALDVDNGITLCHECHKEQHRLDRSLS